MFQKAIDKIFGSSGKPLLSSTPGLELYEHLQDLLTQAVNTFNTFNTGTVQMEITQDMADKVKAEIKENQNLSAYDVADLLLPDYRQKLCYSPKFRSWFIWSETYWKAIDIEELESILHFDMKFLYRPNSPGFYDKVLRFLKSELGVASKRNLTGAGFLNFQNGCLNLTTMEMVSTTPNDWVISVLPRDYSAINIEANLLAQLARDCPVFWEWSNQAMNKDSQKILLLLSSINGILTGKFARYQRFLWLYGVPQSGKGTFTRLLTDLVGKKNIYSTDLNRLDQDSQKAAIANSRVCFLPDQDKCTSGLGTLKALVGQDEISARRLYQEPFSFIYEGTVVATSNSPIFYGDRAGLDRRLLLIHFKNPVAMEDRDIDLSQKLASELDRLTPIALSLPEKLVKDFLHGMGDGKITDFEATKWDVQVESDSLSSWIEERIIFDPTCSEPVGNADSPTNHLFPNYLEYCAQGKFTPKSRNNFSRDLIVVAQALGHIILKRPTKTGKKIDGLRLKNELDEITCSHHQPSPSLQDKLSGSSPGSSPVVTGRHPIENNSLANIQKGDDLAVKGDDLAVKGDDLAVKGDDLAVKGDDLKPLLHKVGDGGDGGDDQFQTIIFSESKSNESLKKDFLDDLTKNCDDLKPLQNKGCDDRDDRDDRDDQFQTIISPESKSNESLKKDFLALDLVSQLRTCQTVEQVGWIYAANTDYGIDARYKQLSDFQRYRLSEFRFKYKLAIGLEEAPGGEVLGWLRAELENYRGLVPDPLIPKNLAYNLFPLSEWQKLFERLDKAQEIFTAALAYEDEPVEPEPKSKSKILTKEEINFILPKGAIATFDQDGKRVTFVVADIVKLSSTVILYYSSDGMAINHSFLVEVILP